MELVYLWVKKYKNIEEQGFNFSPRFNCEYDPKTNKLTIDENDDYIENFFGDNINVTAIVGKNGSGKSSLLEILEEIDYSKKHTIVIYKNEDKYYCRYKNNKPNIIFGKDIRYKNIEDISSYKDNFYPYLFRIAHSKKIGEKRLSHYYFGDYSGLYGGMNIERHNDYNMLDARFFVPRYINIALEYFDIFHKLKNMYKFDTLRLVLRENSTQHIRKYIDDEISKFKDYGQIQHNLNGKFCVYEKNEQTLSRIQEDIRIPIEEVEINLYNRDREKIVSSLEKIEDIHRSQTYDNQIKKHNKYSELDFAILTAFLEYYLKKTHPCESVKVIYDELLILQEQIIDNLSIHDHHMRIVKSYILDFFEKLKEKDFKFDDEQLLTIEKILVAIKYIQNCNIVYFDGLGNPYIDIPINTNLKDSIENIKIMQKIFYKHEFDCGEENYLRVFEYDLINKKTGASYQTISDGEKHFIRFSIDTIYYLQTLRKQNFRPDRETIAFFLADEPDNALHPIWKKKLIQNAIEIFDSYIDMQNITVHFIYSSHSPFLLSDIPKQNIIFLDKDEKGKCIVVDGLKEKKQTFGANIHTLLSDSFFMEDGLMGEFVQGRIDKAINLLNRDKLDEKELKYCEQIISIIGEPIVKNQLQRMLDSKRLKKIDEIDKLYEEIELIKHRIEIMRKND